MPTKHTRIDYFFLFSRTNILIPEIHCLLLTEATR